MEVSQGSNAAIAQLGRASDCHSEGRGFEPRQLLHVAVVQSVEHQIVALVVVDSSSTGHPTLVRKNPKENEIDVTLNTFWKNKKRL